MELGLNSLSSGLSSLATQVGLSNAPTGNDALIAQARSDDPQISGQALRQLDTITGSRAQTNAMLNATDRNEGHSDGSAPVLPDSGNPPTGRPGLIGRTLNNIIGLVDPVKWGGACAVAGGAVGAVAGGVLGAGGGGLVGAGGGTLVAPGIGTVGGGVAGAVEGGAVGAVAGGTAGAVVGGGICYGVGSIIMHMQGANETQGAGSPPATVSPDRSTHILDGDKTGGGHRAGTGTPGKSEFPSSWSDGKIIREVESVANDPASTRTVQPNGRIRVEGTRDGVDIRVILDANSNAVRTAHPTNMPHNP